VLWTLIAVAAALSAVAAMAPLSLWMGAAPLARLDMAVRGGGGRGRHRRHAIGPETLGPTAAFTFELVRHLLTPILPTLHADPVSWC